MTSVARSALMGGVAFTAVLVASPAAIAQDVPGGTAGGQQSADAASARTISGADIIVTAQRREERAQDVPVVVTAFSPERLERLDVNEPQDLYGSVPSLTAGNQGQASRDVQAYAIRGQSTGFLASPGVQSYLGEVPLPATVSLSLQGGPGLFVDMESVQVLSGPQGTLFGRNTTGGAVLFQPRKPTDRFEGYIEGGIGNYDLRSIEGAINVPLVEDKLMVRVVGAYQDRRGYTKDLVWDKWRDDTHWYSGRIGITFKPTERIDNYLLIYGTKSSNNGAGYIHNYFNIPGLIGQGFCTEGPPSPGVLSCDVYRRQTEIAKEIGPRRNRQDVDGFSKIDNWGIINNTGIELNDELTLRNIISFQKIKTNYAGDSDATPLQQYQLTQNADLPDFPIEGLAEFGIPNTPGNVYLNSKPNFNLPRDDVKQFTEELQLQGTMLDDHLTFAVGAFYFNATPAGPWGSRAAQFCPAALTGNPTANPLDGSLTCEPSDGRSGVSNQSKALFAQATLDLGTLSPSLEDLRVTGGYRYTWDRIRGFSSSWAANADGGATCSFGTTAGTVVPPGSDPAVVCNFGATLKSKAPTWTIGVDYKPMRDVLVYAKVSRGYKSGGFNTFAVRPETTTFAPEKLTTYEAGFKSDWRIGGVPLRFNATYYYSKYNNIQRPGADGNLRPGLPPAFGAAIFAAESTIQGLEVEASIRPTEAIEIGGTLSHADGDYKKFQVRAIGVSTCPNGDFAFNPAVFVDVSCAPFQFLTPWIYNIYGSINLPVPESMGKLSLFASYSSVSDQYTAPFAFEPEATVKGYGLLNASLNWNGVAGSNFDLTLFANNLTNKLYRVGNTNSFSNNVVSSLYGEPRMYGVKLKYRFGG